MAYLYGDRVNDVCLAVLVKRLETRGTSGAATAVAVCGRGLGTHGTPEESRSAREAILLELVEWRELESDAPELATVRDRLVRELGSST